MLWEKQVLIYYILNCKAYFILVYTKYVYSCLCIYADAGVQCTYVETTADLRHPPHTKELPRFGDMQAGTWLTQSKCNYWELLINEIN